MLNKFLILLVFIFNILPVTAQEQDELKTKAEELVKKAKIIYTLEKTAWIAGDLIEENKGFDKTNLESYISYNTDNATICVFYSKTDSIFAEYTFSNFDTKPTEVFIRRKPNETEKELIKIKRAVRNKLANNEIKKAKKNEGTNFNLVPVIFNNVAICYLINAISNETKAILGCDYIITLDANLNLIDITGNHKSVQEIPFKIEAKAFSHTHVLSHGFSETEIATLMLYKPYLKTKEFVVISKFYTSIWNNETNTLIIK
jgi:hypothetical protein